jgi:hypothetical protein
MQSVSATTVRELLALGGYHFIHDYINDAHFPDARHTLVRADAMRIMPIDKEMPTEWVLNLIKKKGRHPATIYHALHFAAANPEMEFKLPVIALGTIVSYADPEFPKSKKAPHAIVLHEFSHRRDISLTPIQGKWGKRCSFLTYTI